MSQSNQNFPPPLPNQHGKKRKHNRPGAILVIFFAFGLLILLASAGMLLEEFGILSGNEKPVNRAIETTSNEADYRIGYNLTYQYGYDHARFGHDLPTEVGFAGIAKSRFADSGAKNQQTFAKGIKQGLIDGYSSYQR